MGECANPNYEIAHAALFQSPLAEQTVSVLPPLLHRMYFGFVAILVTVTIRPNAEQMPFTPDKKVVR
jgi:hypothetical protein